MTCTLIGIALGMLFAIGEVLHLTFFVQGGQFRRQVLIYGLILDGGTLGLLGFLIGGILRGVHAVRVHSRDIVTVASSPVLTKNPTRRTALRLLALGTVGAGILGFVAVERRRGSAPRQWVSESAVVPTATSTPSTAVETARAVATSTVPTAPAASVSKDQPPSVILITIDTLRGDQLGAFGNPVMKTPNLDTFARQGARFVNYQIQEPQTNPSHAAMFTGMYPPSNGVRIHMVDKLPDSLDTLATLFKGAGYATAGLFSWMSFDPQYSNFQRGFDVYRDLTVDKPALLSNPVAAQASAAYRTAEQYLAVAKAAAQVTGLNNGVEASAKGRADVTTDAAIAQIRSFGARPFFLWLHYFDPHYPYEPPGSFANLYSPGYTGKFNANMPTIEAIINGQLDPKGADLQRLIALYQGEISYLDSQIGRLFAALDALGLSDHTAVAISGDHGEAFAEHTQFEIGNDFFHPRSLYNDESRVPLILRFPPVIKPDTVIDAPAQAIDLFPTLLDLAGQPVSAQAQGKSLAPLLTGVDDGSMRRTFALMPDYTFTSIVVPGWKLIQNNATGQRRLYNLQQDPGEQHDVLAAQSRLGGTLITELNSWMKAVKIS
ncbi:MAG: sulfatase [Chloroflexi bacterium]|nr:sulfatase [Chloroflexota bacterium]